MGVLGREETGLAVAVTSKGTSRQSELKPEAGPRHKKERSIVPTECRHGLLLSTRFEAVIPSSNGVTAVQACETSHACHDVRKRPKFNRSMDACCRWSFLFQGAPREPSGSRGAVTRRRSDELAGAAPP